LLTTPANLCSFSLLYTEKNTLKKVLSQGLVPRPPNAFDAEALAVAAASGFGATALLSGESGSCAVCVTNRQSAPLVLHRLVAALNPAAADPVPERRGRGGGSGGL
jgi:hypothetical protein